MEQNTVLEDRVLRCDAGHNLLLSLGGIQARIPREEVLSPWISGAQRDIAVLSRVGKPACFLVTALRADEKGAPTALLSRRAVQERAMDFFLEHLRPGSVVTAVVTHLESFGAFLDIGCGIVAMLPIEHISVSRISHPKERFRPGQKILAAVRSIDREKRRITMTHKELLGTWMENASWFHPGETVRGEVRSVKEYGSFIELAPNLSGLADAGRTCAGGRRLCLHQVHPSGADEDQAPGDRKAAALGRAGAAALSDHRRGTGPVGLLPCRV